MPEENSSTDTTDPSTTDGAPGGTTDDGQNVDSLPEWARAALTKANSEAAKYRTRVRELEPFEAKVREIDEASKSDLDKAIERATAAEQRAADLEATALRQQVAMEKGLTPAQAKRLVGSTIEELTADADDLLASFQPADAGRPPSTRPAERLRGGSTPAVEPEETDPRKLAELVMRDSLY